MSWVVLGESAVGTAHQTRNVPCQDAFRFRVLDGEGGWLVLAVADGAGSASHSDIGAKLVCDELVGRIDVRRAEALAGRQEMVDLFTEARAALVREAERLTVPPRELACTALVAVIGPASASFAQVGDGAVVVGDGNGYRVAFWPEPAEYANATDFLSDDRFSDALRFEAVEGAVWELAVFTDGLQRLALDYSTNSPHTPFFQPLFHELRRVTDPDALAEPFRAFLSSPRVNERTDDDKTLVLAIRRP